jgi:hypothetical protein
LCWAASPLQRPTFQQMLKKEWWDKEETLPSIPLTRILIYLPRKICPQAALFWLNTFGFEIKVSLNKFVESLCTTFGMKLQYWILQSSFSKTINFPLFLHIKKFIFEKLDCHLQYIIEYE